jgi:hypothetical protein
VYYSSVLKTLAACDGRYPTEAEEIACLTYAQSLPKRLQAANLIGQKESEIVREAIEEMKPRYPRFLALHERAYEKGARDMELCLRYTVQGMVVNDPDMPKEKLFVWYGTIIRSLGLTPQYAREACQAVHDACRRNLPPEAFATADPYLARMVEDVSNFPEPMKPAIN